MSLCRKKVPPPALEVGVQSSRTDPFFLIENGDLVDIFPFLAARHLLSARRYSGGEDHFPKSSKYEKRKANNASPFPRNFAWRWYYLYDLQERL
jgi:hypothetical protein